MILSLNLRFKIDFLNSVLTIRFVANFQFDINFSIYAPSGVFNLASSLKRLPVDS